MSFQKLVGNPKSRILLANLHDMAYSSLLGPLVQKTALKSLHSKLLTLSSNPQHKSVLKAFGSTLHADGVNYKILSEETPAETERIALVVDYSKVRKVLVQAIRRIRTSNPSEHAVMQTALSSRASTLALRNAAGAINRLKLGLGGLTINDVYQVIWGTPLDCVDALLSDPSVPPDSRANRLRDVLGLIHLAPGPIAPERHMFVFRSDLTLAQIRSLPSHFEVARPTTLDGYDNHRFCQKDLGGRRPGWGNTVDIAAGNCCCGFPEVVLTPMSISHFTCEYIGELAPTSFASDGRYFSLLAPSPPDSRAMAASLDALATAP